MFYALLQWNIVDRIYDMVTYYALYAIFDIIREILSFIMRLYMGMG